jgi:outer membrane protein OmpA-like peptidoglycan-associated protein
MKRFLLALALSACGTTMPPQELVDARAAYQRAASGPAASENPTQLADAKQNLERAETAFQTDGDTPRTRDLAYLAQRRAEYAEAVTDLSRAQQTRVKAEEARRLLTGGALESAQQQVTEERERADRARADAERERSQRLEAERRMQQALTDLSRIGTVREEPRGTVITITGSVLFVTDQTAILPSARARLNEVAETLKMDPNREVTVEGHTDSIGSVQHNMDLSQRRADSVRTYLVSRGVDASHIKAVGVGPSRPIAGNGSPEGRANNRRVEIIVAPAAPE